MNEPTMETLARRLDRVERENRRLKQAGVVALAVIAAVVLMGQVRGRSRLIEATQIRAESFILMNSKSRILGALGISDDGTPLFYLNSKPGEESAPSFMLAVKNDEMSINLFSGKKQAAINSEGLILRGVRGEIQGSLLTLNGFSGLKLSDKDGNDRVVLLVSPKGKSFLTFQDNSGKSIWSAP